MNTSSFYGPRRNVNIRTPISHDSSSEVGDLGDDSGEEFVQDSDSSSSSEDTADENDDTLTPDDAEEDDDAAAAAEANAWGQVTTTCIPYYRKRRIIDATDFNWFTRICHTS